VEEIWVAIHSLKALSLSLPPTPISGGRLFWLGMGNEDRTIDRCQIPFELQGNVPHYFRFWTVATPQAMANSADRLAGCFHSLEVIVVTYWRLQPEQG